VIEREYMLKKRLVELKNELVQVRVREDMGEYNTLIMGKSPSKATPPHPSGKHDSIDKVKTYVEDLTMLREHLLKIEFRNIELEEHYAKREREVDELKAYMKDL
jgi:hypothetical protein